MAYVGGFHHDIFISYAHADNGDGWVRDLFEALKSRIRQYLGSRDRVEIYFDERKLEGNEHLDALLAACEASALLVCVVTPSYAESDWCSNERTKFLETGRGISIGDNIHAMRIFKILPLPLSLDKQPDPLNSQLGYLFFEEEPGKKHLSRQFYPRGEYDGGERFKNRVDGLAMAIAAALEKLRAGSTPSVPGAPPVAPAGEVELACAVPAHTGTHSRICETIKHLEKLVGEGRMFAHADQVLGAFRKSHPAGAGLSAGKDSGRIATFYRAVGELAALPPPANTGKAHPLDRFLETLAGELGGEGGRLLRECLGDSIPAGAAGDSPAPQFDLAADLAAPASCRVTVWVEPAGHPDTHAVAACIRHRGREPEDVPLDPITWTEDNRKRQLWELYSELMKQELPDGQTLLEFVVPKSLLNQEFDQWEWAKLGNNGEEFKSFTGLLGRDFPIIVRPMGRDAVPAAPRLLKRRWSNVQSAVGASVFTNDDWPTEAATSPRAVWIRHLRKKDEHRQLRGNLEGDAGVACAILARPPGGLPAASKKGKESEEAWEVYKALLIEGIPIILWPRYWPKDSDPQTELLGLVRDRPLRDLPDRVYKMRLTERKLGEKARRLTLIWDDPDWPVPPRPEERPLGIEQL